MRLHRFYVSQPLGEEVVIEDVSLIHQWTHVFRYTINDSVILFNGDGNDYCYSLLSIQKKTCTLTLSGTTRSYIPSRTVTLCLSCIKKDNFELAIAKATELGITRIIPIISSRSEKKNISHERLEKIVIESAEQCGRGDVPSIAPIAALATVLTTMKPTNRGVVFTFDGVPYSTIANTLDTKDVLLFVGPEGGWSEDDLALMTEHNFIHCTLGPTVLRAETAAIVATSLFTI
jgi:16S rRNA (uracil1498-N3)-methyltransferase